MSHCPVCQAEEEAFERRRRSLMQTMPDGTVRPVFPDTDTVWNAAVEACASAADRQAFHDDDPAGYSRAIARDIRKLKRDTP